MAENNIQAPLLEDSKTKSPDKCPPAANEKPAVAPLDDEQASKVEDSEETKDFKETLEKISASVGENSALVRFAESAQVYSKFIASSDKIFSVFDDRNIEVKDKGTGGWNRGRGGRGGRGRGRGGAGGGGGGGRIQRAGAKIPLSSTVTCLDIAPGDSENAYDIVLGDIDGNLHVISFPESDLRQPINVSSIAINDLKYSKEKNIIYCAGSNVSVIHHSDWSVHILLETPAKSIDLWRDHLIVCGSDIKIHGENNQTLTSEEFNVVRASGPLIAAGKTGKIQVWDMDQEGVSQEFSHNSDVVKFEFVLDNKGLVTLFVDGSVMLYNLEKYSRPVEIKLSDISDIRICDQNSIYALANKEIEKVKIEFTNDLLFQGKDPIVDFLRGDKEFFSVTAKKVTAWYQNDDEAKEYKQKVICEENEINKTCLLSNQRSLYVLIKDKIKKISLLDNSSSEIYSSEHPIVDFIIDSNEVFLIFSNIEADVTIYNLQSKSVFNTFSKAGPQRKPLVRNMQIVNNYVYYSTNFGFFRKNLAQVDLEEERVFFEMNKKVAKVKISPDGQLVLKSEQKNNPEDCVPLDFKVFILKKTKPIKIVSFHKAQVTDFIWSPDSKYFFVSSEDKTVSI